MTISHNTTSETLDIVWNPDGDDGRVPLSDLDDLEQILLTSSKDMRAVSIIDGGVKGFDIEPDSDYYLKENGIARAMKLQGVCEHLENLSSMTLFVAQTDIEGVGIDLSLCCDRVLLNEKGCLRFSDVASGALPLGGALTRLIRKIGYHKALFHLTLDTEVSAEHAFSLSLVDELCSVPVARAKEIIDKLLKLPQQTLKTLKHFFAQQRLSNYTDSLFKENIAIRRFWGESEHQERA